MDDAMAQNHLPCAISKDCSLITIYQSQAQRATRYELNSLHLLNFPNIVILAAAPELPPLC